MSTRTRALLALAVLLLSATLAGAAGASSQGIRVGRSQPISNGTSGSACVSGTQVWVQEYGKSGVTQFKAQFKRKSPQDLYYYGLPSYGSQGWYYTYPFPDDNRNFYAYFNSSFRYPQGGRYGYWTRLVGVRPGFWRPDRAVSWRMGDIGCEVGPGF